MGAWGYGLFQGDHDLDVIADLNYEIGLSELEAQAKAKARAAPGTEPSKTNDTKQTSEDKEEEDEDEFDRMIRYDLYGNACSDPDAVREYLHNTDALPKLIAEYTTAFRNAKSVQHWYGPEYKLVILAACLMTLGCKLPADLKKLVGKLYPHVGLMAEGQQQMAKALTQYKEGDLWDFESLGLIDTANARDSSMGGGMNVMGVGTLFGAPPKAKSYPDELCGTCGSGADEGHGLPVCAKCKKRKYCDKDCQRIHWGTHRKECKKAEA
ncbi:Hypothetical predicted protein [Lecanosticta acicola]|uniref:MYND-type domain-containing protein n=1 Tax=Lecanosticta acicola TaxID=111012 RepID=A0AAI8Z8H9_9PEZI|nr:Hypothetical predicted protein [Lecanosticta acicola]